MLAEGLRGLPERAVLWRRDPEQAVWVLGVDLEAVSEEQDRIFRRFLRAALRVVETLADRYPDDCSVRRVQNSPDFR